MNPEPPKKPDVTKKPVPKPKPAPAPKVEKPKPKPAPVAAKPAPVAAKPEPVVAKPEPVVTAKKTKAKKGADGYDLESGIAPAPPKVNAESSTKKFELPKLPSISLPKFPEAPNVPVIPEDNAGLGVLVGGAPLVLAPLAALVAGRDLLTKTAARRAEIQNEIAEFEAAQAKKKRDAEADAGGIVKAAVSSHTKIQIFQPKYRRIMLM